MGIRQNDEKCFTETHKTNLNFSLECMADAAATSGIHGNTEKYFEDTTNNHNKVLVEVLRTDTSFCQLFVIIKTRGKKQPIKREVPLFASPIVIDQYATITGNLSVQAEDVEWVALSCVPRQVPTPFPGPPSPGFQACEGRLKITKTFCICCKDK